MSLNMIDIKKISSLFYKILNENEQLRVFYNSISYGSLSPYDEIQQNYTLLIKDEKVLHSSNNIKPLINIISFTTASFSKVLNLKIRNNRTFGFYNQKNEINFLKNQKRYNKSVPAIPFQFNLNSNLDAKYCYLNFHDIVGIVNRYTSIYNIEQIPEAYYIGKKNNLLAIFLRDQNILIIREQTLLSLYKNNGIDQTKAILIKLLNIYLKKIENYEKINIQDISNYSQSFLEFNIYNHLSQWLDVNNFKFEKFSNDQIKELKEYISENIRSFSDNIFRNTVYDKNNNLKYYQEIIQEILNNSRTVQKQIANQSFQDGMILGLKIEMLGWIPKTQNFTEESDSSIIWWKKDVNIIPDTFIYKNERYEIPLKQRKWKITQLFINKKGKMRCIGNHPNVSGSTVCMGDLKINWNDSIDELQKSLQNAETLLDIINFDSAYSITDLSNLLEKSTKIKFLSEKDNIPIRDIKKIKEVSFSDSDEGEEEIIVEKKKENTKTETKKYIIEKIQKYSESPSDENNMDFIESEREENNIYEISNEVFNINADGSLSIVPSVNENNETENNSSLELTDNDIL